MIKPNLDGITRFFWGSRNPYDSVKNPGTREPPKREIASEDWMVRDLDRDYMSTRIRTLTRNYSLAAWAVRKHVDYLTRFQFRAMTGNEEFDRQINAFMQWWGKRYNCDATGKHSLARMIRLMEQCRTVDGDVFLLKIGGSSSRRGKIQLIEAQRIRDPAGAQNANAALPGARGKTGSRDYAKERWVDGVRLNNQGVAIEYAVHRRGPDGDGFTLEKTFPAKALIHHGIFHRVDMIRGISPLNAAANSFRDLYESQVYAAAGIKAAQLVGLIIKQSPKGNTLGAEHVNPTHPKKSENQRQRVKWGPKPETIVLEPHEEAQFIDSRKPSSETSAFMEAMSHMSMKALDIPRSAWDESIANYSSMRSAQIEYSTAQEPKIRETQDTLDELTAWRLGVALTDGELVFPAGMGWDDVRWIWQHTGRPFIDPQKEADAELKKIEMGLSNPIDSAARIGSSYEENIQKTRVAIDLAAEQGLQPVYASTMATTTTEPVEEGAIDVDDDDDPENQE